MKRIFVLALLVFAAIVGTGVFVYRKTFAPGTSAGFSKQSSQQNQSFNKSKYSVDSASSLWVVANKQRPLNPITYKPSVLVAVGNGQYMSKPAATGLAELIGAAKNAGLTVIAVSGYRSYETQVNVYAKEVSNYGQKVADTESARPGFSEHQTGLAVDVGGGGCNIDNCFANTKEGKWVAANSYKYGFIIRYPEGKESVTGYRYEPWHIRYVGVDLAAEIHRTGQALEQFFELPDAPSY